MKFIVTTTIQHPTEATIRFYKKKDWNLIVVGDKKTPSQEKKKLGRKLQQIPTNDLHTFRNHYVGTLGARPHTGATPPQFWSCCFELCFDVIFCALLKGLDGCLF